jgi:hypothetical protein
MRKNAGRTHGCSEENKSFIIEKGGGALQVGSLPDAMEMPCAGKKWENFYFRLFLYHP